MSIALTILLFLVGLVLIIKGGDWFVDAATWMAEASGRLRAARIWRLATRSGR